MLRLTQKIHRLELNLCVLAGNSLNRAVRFTVCILKVTRRHKGSVTQVLVLNQLLLLLHSRSVLARLDVLRTVFIRQIDVASNSNLKPIRASV